MYITLCERIINPQLGVYTYTSGVSSMLLSLSPPPPPLPDPLPDPFRVPKHIFECYVEVARPKEGEDACFTYICPKDYEWEEDTRKQLPKFMFPTIACK